MKKNNIILILLIILSIFIFKENMLIRSSMIESTNIWFKQIFCVLVPTYFIIDLLINYGITNYIRSSKAFLIFISLILGCPSNAKYIDEFLKDGLISDMDAKHLLFSTFSPSLLFLLSLNYHSKDLVLCIYLVNIVLYVLFIPIFKENKKKSIKRFQSVSFTDCIEKSFKSSLNITTLILGIICFYRIIMLFLSSIHLNFLGFLLELTNTSYIIVKNDLGFIFLLFICLFGGVSIHTQVKSIIPEYYSYFLYGRACSLILLLLVYFFIF